MKVLSVLISLCLIGCANGYSTDFDEDLPSFGIESSIEENPNDPRTFHASVDFTYDERDKIRNFLGHLSERTGYYIGIVFDRPHMPTDDDGEFIHGERKVIFKTFAVVGGRYFAPNRVIRIGREGMEDPGMVAWVVAHEIGHDFGFKHVSERGSLMSQFYWPEDVAWNWTDLDQAECKRAGVCK